MPVLEKDKILMKRQTTLGLAVLAGLCGTLALAETRINAAGATFPYPIYSKWFNEFKAEKGVEINYQSIGSGGGISQLTQGTIDFGASDRPVTDAEIAKMKSKPVIFATVLGGIVPTYNVPGISKDMKFTGEALADIFLGKITKWNDQALKAANPGVNLPGSDIVVVHRSDGSGTSFVFTDYLSKVSAEWKSKVGSNQSPNWPVGLAAKGNEGVAGLVKGTPGSIGYV
jgi:phosphate transport system substrate-binding protein